MIDKFVDKFGEFASHPGLEEFSDEVKATLFGIFLEVLKPEPKAETPAQVQTQKKAQRPATPKQTNFIKSLIKKGQLPNNIVISNLSVKQASVLIDQGIKTPEKTHSAPKPDPIPNTATDEPSGVFTGSYKHASGDATSTKHFWD